MEQKTTTTKTIMFLRLQTQLFSTCVIEIYQLARQVWSKHRPEIRTKWALKDLHK